jgi:sulfur carrier protein
MELTVNKVTFQVPDTSSLKQVITDTLKLSASGIAVAVNQEIIARDTWDSYFVKSGDHLTIIKATQGG